MELRLPEMDVAERRVVERVLTALADGEDFDDLREHLRGLEGAGRVWLTLPLVAVAAALVRVIVADVEGDGPWEVAEDGWDAYLPERRPRGAKEWRNAHFVLQAAGCLAAGMWVGVGRQEGYWQWPLWPVALDVVQLLTVIALEADGRTPEDLAAVLRPLLVPAP